LEWCNYHSKVLVLVFYILPVHLSHNLLCLMHLDNYFS